MTDTYSQSLERLADLWRSSVRSADRDRERLIKAVQKAAAAGTSEYELARLTGVSRGTIRVWLGKGPK